MKLSEFKDPAKLRRHLEKIRKIKLNKINQAFVSRGEKITCENLIGETTLPLGIAGPLSIKLLESYKNYYIPLATTEGALVASVSRGCKAINAAGGTKVTVDFVGISRGPVFLTSGIEESQWLTQWLQDNYTQLKRAAESTSTYLKLTKIETKIIGCYVYVRFYFDTSLAMGMNMATIATERIIKLINNQTKIRCLSLTGNYCVDKKPAWLNFIKGRGRTVWAEVILTEQIIEKILKTDLNRLFEVWLTKCLIGSAISGAIGFNAHYANVVAGFYAATGQDLAHVVEGSLGITTMRIIDEQHLYVSVYLPDILIGIVGGGTNLQIKKEGLSIISAQSSEELAAVLGGAVLAGEISLLASLAEESLATAHKKLGRK